MNRNFNIDSEGFTVVYVDGCLLNQGTPQSAAGYGIFWGQNNNNNKFGQSRRGATNNVAEIQGATVAIQQAAGLNIKKLRVVTDSENVYKAVTENIPQWKRNGWRSQYDGQPIRDRSDWEALDNAIRMNSQMIVTFKQVPGHSGIQEHNKADRLAAAGARLHN